MDERKKKNLFPFSSVLVASILVVGLISLFFFTTIYRIRNRQVRNIILGEKVNEILLDTTILYAKYEGVLLKGAKKPSGEEIKKLAISITKLNSIIEKSKEPLGFSVKPLIDDEVRIHLVKYREHLTKMRSIFSGDEKSETEINTLKNSFPLHFENLVSEYDFLKTSLQKRRKESFRRVTVIFWSMVSIWCAVIAIMFAVLNSYRKKSVKALQEIGESENRFSRMAENIDDGVLIIEGERVVFFNEKLCEIFGRSREELMTINKFEQFVAPEDMGKSKKFRDDVIDGKTGKGEFEFKIVRKDGTRRIVNNRYNYVHLEDKRIARYIIVEDITEKKQREVQLKTSEERFRYMGETVQDGLLINEDGKTVYINDRMCEILGRSREEIMKIRKAEEFISPGDRDKMVTLKKDAMGKSLPYVEIECWNEKSDGTKAYVQHRYSVKKTEEGKTYRFIVTTDLTDRKIAEEKVSHLAKVFEDSLSEIYILDAETFKFVEVNKTARDNLGYSMEELKGMTPVDIKPGLTWDDVKTIINEVRTGEKELINFQTTHQRKDGSEYPVEIFLQNIVYKSSPCFLCMVIDISEKLKAEEERKKLQDAIEQLWDIVMISDCDGIISYVNNSFERITGYKKEEAIGRTASFLKSGEQDEEFYREMWEVLSRGETWRGKLVNRKKDGTFYNEETVISPMKNSMEETIGYVAVMRDVTYEMEMESQLLQAQKMEAIGRLAGGVAHDFNNLLVGIIGYGELLKDILPSDNEVQQRYTREIINAGERASSLTKQLLAFGRKQMFHPQIIDINSAVRNLEMMLKRIIGEDIKVEIAFGENVSPIKADADHIAQILLNFAANARDAMPEGGTLRIETSNIVIDEFFAKNHRGAKEGNYVLLEVSDTGCGMDDETLKHIFEPFFTTKDVGKGTGLGLATVYGIVKQNEGYISVYSETGLGSSFKIYLPAAEEKKKIEETEEHLDEVPRGSERVLIVEDEDVVRKMTREILEQFGYEVLDASNGKDALQILSDGNGNIDLILTDIVMPDMRGDVLAKEVLKKNASLKIMFMSGYAEALIAKEDGLFGDKVVVQKPFASKELALKVRKALDSE